MPLMPMTDEYQEILKELFGDNLGEGSCWLRISLSKYKREARRHGEYFW